MKKNKTNIALIAITATIFSLNFTPVDAQQMLVQVIGGGYRLNGPNLIAFPPVAASFNETNSEISLSDFTISDQNGGSEFQVTVGANTPLTHTTNPEYTIPLSNFQIKTSASGLQAIHGNNQTLSINPTLNTYNNLSTSRVLVTSNGDQPGEWQLNNVSMRIQVPPATAIGTYETTLTFTII